jgi:hypothetical protein
MAHMPGGYGMCCFQMLATSSAPVLASRRYHCIIGVSQTLKQQDGSKHTLSGFPCVSVMPLALNVISLFSNVVVVPHRLPPARLMSMRVA